MELVLKWGTLKRWNFKGNLRANELFKEYCAIGSSLSAMAQRDTPRQKEIICELIDLMDERILLDWEGKYVSREEDRKTILIIKGAIAELPTEQMESCLELADYIRRALRKAGEPVGSMALALLGAELLEEAEEEAKNL